MNDHTNVQELVIAPGVTLRFEQEFLRIETLSGREPDPNWSYIDPAGHLHVYEPDGQVPTTIESVTGSHWCEDCRDMHVVTVRRCKWCGIQIEPGTRPAHNVDWVASRAMVRSGTAEVGTDLYAFLHNHVTRSTIDGHEAFTTSVNADVDVRSVDRVCRIYGIVITEYGSDRICFRFRSAEFLS